SAAAVTTAAAAGDFFGLRFPVTAANLDLLRGGLRYALGHLAGALHLFGVRNTNGVLLGLALPLRNANCILLLDLLRVRNANRVLLGLRFPLRHADGVLLLNGLRVGNADGVLLLDLLRVRNA